MTIISRKAAETAVASILRKELGDAAFRSGTSHDGHLAEWQSNLMPGIDADLVYQDLSDGSGGELKDKPDGTPAKFCAPYSSSALCVNSFGLARIDAALLSVAGLTAFGSCKFEQKLPTGLDGTPPNLDLVASSPDLFLAVESKFLEPLGKKKAEFAESYRCAYAECGDAVLNRAYQSVASGSEAFAYLDVAQLLKHSLGVLKHSEELPAKVLLYAYWEPTNAVELEPFVSHWAEIERFKTIMAGSNVEFRAVSYRWLWNSWRIAGQPGVLREHADRLLERYTINFP